MKTPQKTLHSHTMQETRKTKQEVKQERKREREQGEHEISTRKREREQGEHEISISVTIAKASIIGNILFC